ncbi:MAG: winged helix-turn-helix domain-containing protein [Sulfurospirillaceae bacterium]|jgi:DNA-binding response OmpR family regulator|nr:winged helix-turn-helix domain-containing protein [Sulfurospirillaceae bacterium]MDD2825765.1 winged helix-turn-helix domain-containing protein [Sulfurospirillaceae bacterium]
MKILLFEQNKLIQKEICARLSSYGYNTKVYELASLAMPVIDDGYSGYILEMSHDLCGSLSLLKAIKEYYPTMPVIMLHLSHELDYKTIVKAYAYGCDDFIKYPFCIDELEMKIKHFLNIRQDSISLGTNCSFDFGTKCVHIGKTKQRLTIKEDSLFGILYAHKNHLVTFDMIKTNVWDNEYITIDSIRSLVYRLRKKLTFLCIETIAHKGYVLWFEEQKPYSDQLIVAENQIKAPNLYDHY